jgi:hypothetical protein
MHALAWAANRTIGSSSYIPPGPSLYFCTACDLTLELSGLALHEQRSVTHIENSRALALVLPQPVMQYPSPIAGQAEEQGAFEGTEWPSSSSDGPGGDWMLGRSDDIEFANHLLVGEVYVVALPGNNLIRQSLVERSRDWKAYGRWRVIDIKPDGDDVEVRFWATPYVCVTPLETLTVSPSCILTYLGSHTLQYRRELPVSLHSSAAHAKAKGFWGN